MTSVTMVEYERILSDPASAYQMPEDVLVDVRLTREQKIIVLKQWAFDERELEVAEEENMRGGLKPLLLDQVMIVLHRLERTK